MKRKLTQLYERRPAKDSSIGVPRCFAVWQQETPSNSSSSDALEIHMAPRRSAVQPEGPAEPEQAGQAAASSEQAEEVEQDTVSSERAFSSSDETLVESSEEGEEAEQATVSSEPAAAGSEQADEVGQATMSSESAATGLEPVAADLEQADEVEQVIMRPEPAVESPGPEEVEQAEQTSASSEQAATSEELSEPGLLDTLWELHERGGHSGPQGSDQTEKSQESGKLADSEEVDEAEEAGIFDEPEESENATGAPSDPQGPWAGQALHPAEAAATYFGPWGPQSMAHCSDDVATEPFPPYSEPPGYVPDEVQERFYSRDVVRRFLYDSDHIMDEWARSIEEHGEPEWAGSPENFERPRHDFDDHGYLAEPGNQEEGEPVRHEEQGHESMESSDAWCPRHALGDDGHLEEPGVRGEEPEQAEEQQRKPGHTETQGQEPERIEEQEPGHPEQQEPGDPKEPEDSEGSKAPAHARDPTDEPDLSISRPPRNGRRHSIAAILRIQGCVDPDAKFSRSQSLSRIPRLS